MARLIWAFAGCTGHFVGFVVLWLIYWSFIGKLCYRCKKWAGTWQNQQNEWVPSEGLDQTGRMPRPIRRPVWSESGWTPSLIRVFAVCMKKAWVPSYPLSAQQRLWSALASGRMPRLIWVFAWGTLILLVLTCRGSFIPTSVWSPISEKHFSILIIIWRENQNS